jgi:hypothetical protein
VKSSLRALSGSLLAATLGTSAFGGLNEAAAFDSNAADEWDRIGQ